jgi:hypothetical protein
VSLDEVSDLRDRVANVSERLARMEERQITLISMLERSLSNFGDLSNRVNAIEGLKTKMLLVAGGLGAIISIAWDFVKSKLINGG